MSKEDMLDKNITNKNEHALCDYGMKLFNLPKESFIWDWNKEEICKSTGSFAYALNLLYGFTPYYPLQIGDLSNNYGIKLTADNAINYIKKDLESMGRTMEYTSINPNFEGKHKIPKDMDKIAVFFGQSKSSNKSLNKSDIIFYKKDKLGGKTWSYKLDMEPVSIKDAAGKPIFDPLKSNRNFENYNYDKFLGCFLITSINPCDSSIYYNVSNKYSIALKLRDNKKIYLK